MNELLVPRVTVQVAKQLTAATDHHPPPMTNQPLNGPCQPTTRCNFQEPPITCEPCLEISRVSAKINAIQKLHNTLLLQRIRGSSGQLAARPALERLCGLAFELSPLSLCSSEQADSYTYTSTHILATHSSLHLTTSAAVISCHRLAAPPSSLLLG